MFEDVERIIWLTPEEHKQCSYYLRHPKEYKGDYPAFRKKYLDFVNRMHTGEAHKEYYESILRKRRNAKKERIMMMDKMTKSEEQIMNLLWRSDKPLSCAEIIELSDNKTWQDSYVHSLIKSLLKKELVKIESFELISRSYARKFAPKISCYEYVLFSSFLQEDLRNPEKMTAFIQTILQYSDTNKLKNRIKQIL